MSNSIAFAYFANDKFIGWYADSFGSVRTCPKLYSDLDRMIPIIQKNLSYKLKKIKESSFDKAKTGVENIFQAIGLATFDSEELLRDKEVELRAVECPEYDGPNLDFDREAYENACAEQKELMKKEGIFDIPAPSKERTAAVEKFRKDNPYPKCDNWTYADYEKVKEWAKTEPTEFITTIKPDV